MPVNRGLTWNPIKHVWEEAKEIEVGTWYFKAGEGWVNTSPSQEANQMETCWEYDSLRQAWKNTNLGNFQGIADVKTEGTKYDNDKLRLDLLPFDALMEVAQVYTMGAKKYSDRNWERGLSYMRVVGALLRHLFAWICGEERASDDKQRHLASVAWCALALLAYELRGMHQFDDRPL